MAGARRVIVAVVFLGLLGAGVGYGLGALSRHYRAAAAPATDSRPRCIRHTEEAAQVGPLYQVLYVSGEGREVWICQDDNGNLYYQGHNGASGDELVEGKNALFLPNVEREGPDGYVARNRDAQGGITEYHVTPDLLRIVFPSGAQETHRVTT